MFSSFLMQNGTTFWPTGHTRRHNIPASIEHDWRKEKKKVFDESQKTVIGQALSSTRKLPVTGTFYLVKLNTFQTFLSLKRQSRSFYWSYKVLNFDLYIFRHFYICKGPTEMCEVGFLFNYIYIFFYYHWRKTTITYTACCPCTITTEEKTFLLFRLVGLSLY